MAFLKGLLVFIFFNFIINIHSQEINNIAVKTIWYSIVYDENGNEYSYVDENNLPYDEPIIIKTIYEGIEDNNFVKITIVDDAENTVYEEIKEIKNNEIEIKCSLLTTKERLSKVKKIDDALQFKIYVNIMNRHYFESEYVTTSFNFVLSYMGYTSDTHDKYILKSADDEYYRALDITDDGIPAGQYRNLKFTKILPNKNYTLIYKSPVSAFVINEKGKTTDEIIRWENRSFYRMFSTLD